MRKYLFLLFSLMLLTGCESNELIGEYVADGTQDVLITENEPKDEIEPYKLELKKDYTFILEAGEDIISGTYEINEDKIFMQQDDGTVFACEKIDDDLNCDMYAKEFIKQN